MRAELPLIGRESEFGVLAEVIRGAAAGRGGAALLTGEPGVGKSRLLREAARGAQADGLLVLRGQAAEGCGAYRPLVDAFARPASGFVTDQGLNPFRPILARVLPGWTCEDEVFAPMADPAAVVSEALIALLARMTSTGAVLVLDDLHWADPDSIAALGYLVASLSELSLALVMAARVAPEVPVMLTSITLAPTVHRLPLGRLSSTEVGAAFRAADVSDLPPERFERLVEVTEGLPLVVDDVVEQIRQADASVDVVVGHTSFAAGVRHRARTLPPHAGAVTAALAVLGGTTLDVLRAATGLASEEMVIAGLRHAIAGSILVPVEVGIGADWRHAAIRDVVMGDLLVSEQRRIARAAADYLSSLSSVRELEQGELRQIASWYELAGRDREAVDQLIAAGQQALRGGALQEAERCLRWAERLGGTVSAPATAVLIERLHVLVYSGRAREAFSLGMAGLAQVVGAESEKLLAATTQAAMAAGLLSEAAALVARSSGDGLGDQPAIALVKAQLASAQHRRDASILALQAAQLAQDAGLPDLACEAWVTVGEAARRWDLTRAAEAFDQALQLSLSHRLPMWQVRALSQLGMLDVLAASDTARLEQARALAESMGMRGAVADQELRIGECLAMRDGFVPTYPLFARADAQARHLGLTGLYALTRAQILHCLVHADDHVLPGRSAAATSAESEAVLAEALTAGRLSKPVEWAATILDKRDWFRTGDPTTVMRRFEDTLIPLALEQKATPTWSVWALWRVSLDADAEAALEILAGSDCSGHHGNRAALAYGRAVLAARRHQPVEQLLDEGDELAAPVPYLRAVLRTIIAPQLHRAGQHRAEAWLREANALFASAGERGMQRRVKGALADIGVKIRTPLQGEPSHLAKLGLTRRETEILRLVNSGLSNAAIAAQLVISVRTVESHVSSLLQKTGCRRRADLARAGLDTTPATKILSAGLVR